MPLKDILRSLLTDAGAAEDGVASARLAKGLGIRVKLQGNIVLVQLSREKVYPSVVEWKTTLACWPEPVHVEIEPKLLDPVKGRYYLRGALRREQSLLKEASREQNR